MGKVRQFSAPVWVAFLSAFAGCGSGLVNTEVVPAKPAAAEVADSAPVPEGGVVATDEKRSATGSNGATVESIETEPNVTPAREAPVDPAPGAADAAWAEAERLHTVSAYEDFRTRFPEHPQAEEARRLAAVLGRAAPEQDSVGSRPPDVSPDRPVEGARNAGESLPAGDELEGGQLRTNSSSPKQTEAPMPRTDNGATTDEPDAALQQAPRSKRSKIERYRNALDRDENPRAQLR